MAIGSVASREVRVVHGRMIWKDYSTMRWDGFAGCDTTHILNAWPNSAI